MIRVMDDEEYGEDYFVLTLDGHEYMMCVPLTDMPFDWLCQAIGALSARIVEDGACKSFKVVGTTEDAYNISITVSEEGCLVEGSAEPDQFFPEVKLVDFCLALYEDVRRELDIWTKTYLESMAMMHFGNRENYAHMTRAGARAALLALLERLYSQLRWRLGESVEPPLDEPESRELYVAAKYPFPICNHTENLGPENVGYTQGVLSDGTPFEAELWESKKTLASGLYIVMADNGLVKPELSPEEGVGALPTMVDAEKGGYIKVWVDENYAILADGMVVLADHEEFSTEANFRLAKYLEEAGMVRCRDSGIATWKLADEAGHELIAASITLRESDGRVLATTPLEFRPFRQMQPKEKVHLQVVRGGIGK